MSEMCCRARPLTLLSLSPLPPHCFHTHILPHITAIGIILSVSYLSISRKQNYPHFRDEKTEPQKKLCTSPKSHKWFMTELGSLSRQTNFRVLKWQIFLILVKADNKKKLCIISRMLSIKTKNKQFLSFFQLDHSVSELTPNIKHNFVNQNIALTAYKKLFHSVL